MEMPGVPQTSPLHSEDNKSSVCYGSGEFKQYPKLYGGRMDMAMKDVQKDFQAVETAGAD